MLKPALLKCSWPVQRLNGSIGRGWEYENMLYQIVWQVVGRMRPQNDNMILSSTCRMSNIWPPQENTHTINNTFRSRVHTSEKVTMHIKICPSESKYQINQNIHPVFHPPNNHIFDYFAAKSFHLVKLSVLINKSNDVFEYVVWISKLKYFNKLHYMYWNYETKPHNNRIEASRHICHTIINCEPELLLSKNVSIWWRISLFRRLMLYWHTYF